VVWIAALGLARLLAPVAWPGEPPWRTVATLAVAALLVLGVAIIGFLVDYAVTLSANLCGPDGTGSSSASLYPSAAAYVAVGALAARGSPRRALWLWPLAVAVALGVDLAVTAAIPSNHGSFCES
jgi:hypothetical protein